MNRPVVMLLLALGGAACIDANRSQRPTATVPSDGDDGGGDVATTDGGGDDARPDSDTGPVECDNERLCEQPTAPCAEAVCTAGRCVVQQRAPNSPCEDNERCTGDGTCQGDTCMKGSPLEDGTDCDDDAEICNGTAACEGGVCVATLPGTCPQLAAPCVDAWECSEALGGACAPVFADDGSQCQLGPEARGECSLGACVPDGMVWIAEGVFTLGCDDGALCPLDARPAHDVMLTGYAIDRTEVTEEAWGNCVAKGECQPRVDEEKPAVTNRDPDEPVRDVSWSGALQLCTAQGKVLCTEAQWEKAARGTGDELNFPWGNTPATCERAVFHELAVGPGCGEEGPHKVGSKPAGASPYGVLDMAGNVAEWVRDGYTATFYAGQVAGTPTDPVNESSEAGVSRVIRGGGWGSLLDGLRVFKRTSQTIGFVDDEVGLRCCWAPDTIIPVGDQ